MPAITPSAEAGAVGDPRESRVYLPNSTKSADFRRSKGVIMVRNLVSVARIEEELALRATLPGLAYMPDWREPPRHLIWGFYGNRDIPLAAELATIAHEKKQEKKQRQDSLWEVEIRYSLPHVSLVRTHTSPRQAEETETLPIERINASWRATLHQQALVRLRERLDAGVVRLAAPWSEVESLSFVDLLIFRPELVWDLFDEMPWLQAVLHRAAVKFDGQQPEVLQIATMRADPQRIVRALVVQHPFCRIYL